MPIAIGRCYIFHSTNGDPQLSAFGRRLSLLHVTIAPDLPVLTIKTRGRNVLLTSSKRAGDLERVMCTAAAEELPVPACAS